MTDDNDLQIRVATPDDLTEVMKLAVLGAQENSFLNVSQELILQTVWPALNQDHGLIGVIGKPHGFAEGMVVLRIGTMYYSNDPCVEEKIIVVHPDYRSAKGGRARKLCEFSKKVADVLDLPLLVGVCSSNRTAGKVKMYERIFGPSAGAYWLYKTSTGGHKIT
jgi:hypothetical protein